MKKITYILFLAVCGLTSCVQDLKVSDDSFSEKIVVNSEIDANGNVYAVVSTNVAINSTSPAYRPKTGDLDAYIVVNGDETNIEPLSFGTYYDGAVHAGDNDEIWRCRRLFLPDPGTELELRISLVDKSDVKTISAKTTVPEPVEISNLEFIGQEEGQQDVYEYRIQMSVDGSSSDYYHLFAKDGDTNLNLSSFEFGSNAIETPHHHFGALVNGSRLNENILNFVIESDKALTEADIQLRTTTKAYYDYHVSLSRSYSSQNSPFNEPTLNYSNVENGLGVFSSYSTVNQTVELK